MNENRNVEKAEVSPDLETFISYGNGNTDATPETILREGRMFKDEPKFKNMECYMIGAPSEYGYPEINFHFNAPMDWATAKGALEVVRDAERADGTLASRMSRLYKVSIEEV